MKAAVIEKENVVCVKDIKTPEVMDGSVLVKVTYGGFCGPTEMCIIEGLHPRATFPLVFCHEFSGSIEKTGRNSTFEIGDRVVVNPLIYCNECDICKQGDRYICENLKLIGIDSDGGFAEYCLVPEANIVKIPDSLPMELAAIVEPVAVGIHAVRSADVKIGDSVLIFGAGPIGMIIAEVCKSAGASEIFISELNKKRCNFAQSLGFTVVRDIRELQDAGKKFDIVLDTSGAEAVLPYMVDLAKIKGLIAIVGKFDFPAKVNLHDVLFKEITMKGFRVYGEEEFNFAVDVLANEAQRYKKLVTDIFELDKINDAIEAFKNKENLCKIVIKVQ